jgi:hypothetical protein
MSYNYNKTVVEGDLWYIENFLTQEELDFYKPFMDDKNGWYTTMRSPYKNILNKFIENELPLNPDGSVNLPTKEDKILNYQILGRTNGLYSRIKKVMPPTVRSHSTLQTFKYCTDEEIKRDLNPNLNIKDPSTVDFAMDWHSEWSDSSAVPEFYRSYSIYLNDDFEGGELEFKYKPYKIKPKAGMLVSVPVTPDFTHRVSKITSGNWRHSLYGASWGDIKPELSTPEVC